MRLLAILLCAFLGSLSVVRLFWNMVAGMLSAFGLQLHPHSLLAPVNRSSGFLVQVRRRPLIVTTQLRCFLMVMEDC